MEDEAGNSAEDRFTVRMDVRSPAVELTCATYSQDDITGQNSELSMTQAVHLATRGQKPLHVFASWKIPDDQLATASEKAPRLSDVTATVVMPAASREHRVFRKTRQINVYKRLTKLNDDGEGESCKDNGANWARVWSDGQCEPHYGDTQGSTVTTMDNTGLVQELNPEQKVIRLRGGAATPVEVAYENTGVSLDLAHAVSGKLRLQYKFRMATEYERHVSWPFAPDRVFLDERLFVNSMFTSHHFGGGSVEVDGFPAPAQIKYRPSCERLWGYRDL